MKSKNVFHSSLSVFLSLIMVFSAFAVPAFASNNLEEIPTVGSAPTVNVLAYQQTLNFAQINMSMVTPTPSTFQGILKGFASGVATRAVKEITTLLIKEDIPGLSKALIAMQDPATRAELQHKQLVQEMATQVANIERSVENIEKQLSEIDGMLSDYATAQALKQAIYELNKIVSKYQAAWGNYEAVITAGAKLSELEALYPAETRTEEQKLYISSAEADLKLAVNMFINVIEEGGGYPFLSDLEKLPKYLWNPSDKTLDYNTSYLGAYEAYLRERYPFEHQITDALGDAFETSLDIQTQMLILYREYYTYKKSLDPNNEAYAAYTPDYFTKIQYGLIANTAAMAESTGFESYIRPRPYTEEELAEIKSLDSTFVEGENINSEITINGKTYKAYKIRSNKNLSYYKIISEEIPSSYFVEKIYSASTNKIDLGKDIYRPSFMLEGKYSDDGLYRMISSLDDLDFSVDMTNILSTLRDQNGCNLSELPQTISHLLFYSENFESPKLKDAYWTLATVPVSNIKESPTGKKTSDIHSNSSFVPLIIYTDMFSSRIFGENDTLVLNDRGLIENQIIVIRDGQTLDISQINMDISNATIFINGGGKIVSNPNITLKNSSLVIAETNADDLVYIKNLNIVAPNRHNAALTIKRSCNVAFEGENSFVGTSSSASATDIYKYFNYNSPSFASHGIFAEGEHVILAGAVDGKISLQSPQKVTSNGAGGGAGICHNGTNLTIRCLDVTANGSELSVDDDISQGGEQLYTIGAGIGACISGIIDSVGSFDYQTDEKTVSLGDYTKNRANYITIELSKITAKGVKSSRKIPISSSILGEVIYSEDIGGISIPEANEYYCVKAGTITDSTVTLKKLLISSRISTKSENNIYQPESYKITAYTKGSNGVTTDGVYFKLNGSKGSTDWMLASKCGNDKGEWSGTVEGISVGKINTVEVKTKSSNHWYPGKITITAELCGESITVWGGRWIGNSGTTLSPSDNIYEVKVVTGSDTNAGTDADISLFLTDKNGITTDKINLSDIHQKSNAFEKGDTDTFPIYAPKNFKECISAHFYSNHKFSAAGWQLGNFTINKVQGGTDGFSFTSGQWFEKEGTIKFGKQSGYTGSFYIEVKTQDASGAGTDSDIWIKIIGDNGETEEIELDLYAGSGNNFEKNAKDCFRIGSGHTKYIGNIEKIQIRKNDSGPGADWKLDYIEITEEVADGEKPQIKRFNIGAKIQDKTYVFENPQTVLKSSNRIDRDILNGLKQNDDGSYTLSVDRSITISEEVFGILKEKEVILNVNMKDDDKIIYSIAFNGALIEDYSPITLQKSYSFSEGNALINSITDTGLPKGTKIQINASSLGIDSSDTLVLFTKDETGEWNEYITLLQKDGFIEIPISVVKEFLINKNGSSLPEIDQDVPAPGDTNNSIFFVLLGICSLTLLLSLRKKSLR